MGRIGNAIPPATPASSVAGVSARVIDSSDGSRRGVDGCCMRRSARDSTRRNLRPRRRTADEPRRRRYCAVPPSGGGGCGVKPTGVMHDDRSKRMNSIASSSDDSGDVASQPVGTTLLLP